MFRNVVMAAVGAAALACTGAAWAGPADDPANWRKVDPENLLQFMINKQEVLIELRPDMAPKHVEQVKKITRDTNYDKLPFHRVIDDFMAQGGEVYAIYQVYPRYPMLKQEFTWQRNPSKQKVQWFGQTPGGDKLGYLEGFVVQGQPDEIAAISDPPVAKTWGVHCAGVTSMARANDPDSADTQFFLMRHPRVGPEGLDQKYTVWGRALTGVETIQAIKVGPTETDGRFANANQADKLTKAMVVADIPEKKRPTVYVRRTNGPEFAATLATLTAADPYEACKLPPVEVIVERPTP
ncbi:MAG TPA: peptidylprolyl isomerase [Hyphomonadaceae bacterium]|nr:peptidylprolyl isomerase [Hyphomonadaceae bacterium]HPN06355.1 peptidylprolyl isomerase [Hyphomonadaceae bacterium]